MSLLRLVGVARRFGGRKVLEDVSFEVQAGEVVGLIGPNGAGKTTLLNIVTGHLTADAGRVELEGRRIDGLEPFRISRMGVRRTFQLTRNFPRLTVLQNCLVAARAWGIAPQEALQRAWDVLEQLGLHHLAHEPAAQLSGGQQKLLELASCFVVRPKLVLLDEPFAAVHPTVKQTIARYLRQENQRGCAFLVVSHDVPAFRDLCHRLVALAAGRVLADGPPQRVLEEPAVVDAYLGGPEPAS